MSKFVIATMLAMVLSYFTVGCSSLGMKPASADSSMTSAAAAPTPPAVVDAVSPWKGAGIFFYPFVAICILFGVSIYMSKPA
jgi:hypothetical protein